MHLLQVCAPAPVVSFSIMRLRNVTFMLHMLWPLEYWAHARRGKKAQKGARKPSALQL
jgi:hypothetical protein